MANDEEEDLLGYGFLLKFKPLVHLTGAVRREKPLSFQIFTFLTSQ